MFYLRSERLNLEGKLYTTINRRFATLSLAENEAEARLQDIPVQAVVIARPAGGKGQVFGMGYLKRQDIIRFEKAKDGTITRKALV